MNLSRNSKLVQLTEPQTAGTGAIESDVVDTAGFEGVMFFGSIAVEDSGNFAKVQQGDESNLSDAADLEGSKVVVTTNQDSYLIDVYRPEKRYLRVHVTRAGSSTATGDIYALLYSPAHAPRGHGATIEDKLLVSPAEGTA